MEDKSSLQTYYQITITQHKYRRWLNELSQNRPLAPEIAGYLLGLAQPIFIDMVNTNKEAL